MGLFRIEVPVRVREYDAHGNRWKADSEAVGALRFQVEAASAKEALVLVSSYMETRLTPPPRSTVPPSFGEDGDHGAAVGDDT